MQNNKEHENTRRYYRIKYPFFYQPKIKIEGEDIESHIIELSERGCRFLYEGTSSFIKGSEMRVTIIFHDGAEFQFSGDILAAEGKNVILHFSGCLPLSRIMEEQRYIMSSRINHL
jgi:hypothetical protein